MADLSDRIANLSPAQRALLEKRLAAKSATGAAQNGPAPDAPRATPEGESARVSLPEGAAEPVAIIGRACRFAGARNVAEFWRLIRDGVEGITDVPPNRWPVDEFYDPSGAPGKTVTRRGGFVDPIDEFDPTFFGLTPREAGRMDPQQRMLLEVAWEALDDALWPADQAGGSDTGVFVGIGGADYAKVPSRAANFYQIIDAHMGTGNALSIASNRISYVFDLRGPSLSVDTACSSSSMAIHLAVESLRAGDCRAALAGGVNAILTPETTIAFSKAHMLSPEGRCRPFDSGANGYVRGEGCALVVLKTLSAAVADGDQVLALLRATATNQDGRTSGISAPNGERQKACILDALREAKLTPEDIDYVEAHGTSTPLGDPIETQALSDLFRRKTDDQPPLLVTSVKANIGHTETVSGVAGVIKTVELLRHEVTPPQLHLERLNPHIQLDGSRVVIPREATPWPRGERPRIAGVSSFGFGGANTHLIVSEAPSPRLPVSAPLGERSAQVIKIATKTEDRVAVQAARIAESLREQADATLPDIAHTLNAGRSDFNHRAAIAATSREQLLERLEKLAADEKSPGVHRGKAGGLIAPPIAWLYTGQGAQRPGMGRELYETEPVYRAVIDRCAAALDGALEHPLREVLYPSNEQQGLIDETRYTQPALLATECALAELWRSWGVLPDMLLGHSIGEYAAAVTAGVMPLESAARLVAERARLMHSAPGHGAMAVLFLPEHQVAESIALNAQNVAIAAVNGPENTVISGDAEVVQELFAAFDSRGQMLSVSHGFHSPLMDPMLDAFERFAERLAEEAPWNAPSIPLASNLTGEWLTTAPSPRYWRDHLRGTVRFASGVQSLSSKGAQHWFEIGPAPVLLGMARRCQPAGEPLWLPSLRPGLEEGAQFAESLASHYSSGGRVDWRRGDHGRRRRRVELPSYPYERVRCWYEGLEENSATIASSQGGSPLLGARLPLVGASEVYESGLSSESPGYLIDHQVQGSVVAPGAMYLEQALSAASRKSAGYPLRVDDLHIQQAMFLTGDQRRRVQTMLAPESGGRIALEVHSTPVAHEQNGEPTVWEQHASAVVVLDETGADAPQGIDLNACDDRLVDVLTAQQFYDLVGQRGLAYGPNFRMIAGVNRSAYDAVVPIELPESVRDDLRRAEAYQLHPALGDALMQAVACCTPLEEDGSYSPHTYMPVCIGSARLHSSIDADEPLRAYVVRRSPDPDSSETSPEVVVADAYLAREDCSVLVSLSGVVVQRIGSGAAALDSDPLDWLFYIEWRDAPTDAEQATAQGAWLLFVDDPASESSVGAPLADHLNELGNDCVVVRPGSEYSMRVVDSSEGGSRTEVSIVVDDPAHYERLLSTVAATPGAKPAAVVHLWGLDLSEPDSAAEEAWEATNARGLGSLTHLLQQVTRRSLASEHGLWVVTRNAQAVDNRSDQSVVQSTLVGLGRVALMEQPELGLRLLDIDRTTSAEVLYQAITVDDGENQVALRGDHGRRLVARLAADEPLQGELRQATTGAMEVPRGPHQLRIPRPGSFDALRYVPIDRTPPGPGEVELEVHATGLNFSDVLKALGLYPGIRDAIVPLGIEASGVVTAVGPDVAGLNVGDEVLGVAPYAFGSHTTTADYALALKPEGLSHEEAATIPITYLTAHHALVRLAHLQKGERVLIHAGAGGVGLAAIQIAHSLGAEVFSTAGSDEKRELLKSLGVSRVMNSRTLDFVDEVREATDREGVDVVLNSLPGEAIPSSLSLLRAYGRFLEIGKIDIYQDRKIGLLPFQDNLSYFAIDLDRVLRERPDYIRGLFAEVLERFADGTYRPLPYTRFRVEETAASFRYMSQRKNIGKVVVSKAASANEEDHPDPTTTAIRADSSYLITGGLGALGLRVAEWLADQGAGGVALLSRREPGREAAESIDRLGSRGVRVATLKGDVTDAASLRAGLLSLPKGFPKLRGVVHAAGVLDDCLLTDLTPDRLRRVLAPKTLGAWNLHAATLDTELPFVPPREGGVDLFVLFSSVAAILGSPGQANYAAANASLDALAHMRRSLGLAAASINWGPWAGSGMASGAKEDAVRQKGMDLLAPDHALALLGKVIASKAVQTTAIDPRWDAMAKLLAGRKTPLLSDLISESHGSGVGRVDSALRSRLAAAEPAERRSELRGIVGQELARVMGVDPEQIDPTQPLSSLGLDSLMALELKNNLEGMLDFTLPMAKLLEGPSVQSLAEVAADSIVSDEQGATTPSDWSPFVTLREGDGRPFFLLPALGGDALCYREMIDLLQTKRPLLAFRPRGMDDSGPAHDRRDELVDDYVAAIRSRQPKGPYSLAGWSTGGITGFAMAERLEKEGERVGLLALFDTPMPSVYDAIDPDNELAFLVTMVDFAAHFSGLDFAVTEEQLSELPPEERFGAVLQEAIRAGMFPQDIEEAYVRRMVSVGEALVRASRGYQPDPIAADLHFFSPAIGGALDKIIARVVQNETGWREEIGQSLTHHTVSGDHFTMMTGDGAKEIASVLDGLL